jgi:tetratricopeptide (TPR) repeat protein
MKKILFFLLLFSVIGTLYSQQRDYTAKWLYDYGNYTKTGGKNDPRVKWAFEVFERVKGVADKAEARFPRLWIIDSRSHIYARSVPDGGIIIDLSTLDICFRGVSREEGNLRLAFILGHELAHLANKDYIHHEAFAALQENGNQNAQEALIRYFKLSDPEKRKAFRERELLADQKGVLYASMAGYDVGKLFWNDNNFFTYWAQQTGVGMFYDESPRHPSMIKRLQFIRPQLQTVVKRLELFRAGVLLFQIENYHDAAAAFQEFAKFYPAREVLNNLGACYLNLALHQLHLYFGDDYYRFRLSTAIDYATTAIKMRKRGEGDYLKKDKDIAGYINRAVQYFRQAVEKDHLHRASHCNLAAALILQKEYAGALAVCKTLLKRYPRDVNALNNQAVAFYYHGKEEDLDTAEKALRILETALQSEPGNFEVLYNLASIKESRKRMAGAKKDWEKYLKLKTVPMDNFYIYIYKKFKGAEPSTLTAAVEPPKIPGGIRLGDSFSSIEKKWGKKYSRGYKLGAEDKDVSNGWAIDLQVIVKNNVRVVAVGGTIEIIEQELSQVDSISKVINKFGMPQKLVHHTGGNFYVYKDRSFAVKEVSERAYSYIWFEKGF